MVIQSIEIATNEKIKANFRLILVPKDLYVKLNKMNCFEFGAAIHWYDHMFAKRFVESETFQKFIGQKETFDVVIVQIMTGNALLSLGNYYNAPVIGMSPSAINKWMRHFVGAPNLASFIPNILTGYSDRMNFWQRAHNSMCYLFDDMVVSLKFDPQQQEIIDIMYPMDVKVPTYDVIAKNVSLLLYNSNPVFEHPSPVQPNLIPVGGLFIDQNANNSLPTDIQSFLDNSNGAFYIAFGSNLDISAFEEEKKNAIFNAFSEYPNMRILLQSRENIQIPSHKTSDVMIRPWYPQQAILAHKKVKVFITHGGLLRSIGCDLNFVNSL